MLQALDELAQARNGADDLADRLVTGLFARICNELAGHALDLAHAEAGRHQPAPDTHNATHAAEHSAAIALTRRCHGCLCAWQLSEQGVHLLGDRKSVV